MSKSDRIDRRESARVKVSVPVEIQTDSIRSRIRGATADLSLGGLLHRDNFPIPNWHEVGFAAFHRDYRFGERDCGYLRSPGRKWD
jgi:hypothetical protein